MSRRSPMQVGDLGVRPIVFDMLARREWDVTIRGRIENVTDDLEFPSRFQAALQKEGAVSIVVFDQGASPHSTSVIVRAHAKSAKTAELAVRELVLRIYMTLAEEITGESSFGWTLSTQAVPARRARALEQRRRWSQWRARFRTK
jgi:hypothetical protein